MGGQGSSLLHRVPGFKPLHIVMLGLDSAGKTTVLYRLKLGEFVNALPTVSFNTEHIRFKGEVGNNMVFKVWDVGGQEKLRPLWRPYTRGTDGIVFVVDSVDKERLDEARTEIFRVARYTEHQGVPILIFANKQDLPGALSVQEVEETLSVSDIRTTNLCHVQPTCAIIGEGLTEGLEALYQMIKKRRKMLKQQKKRGR
ncbi:PREDICTED: ADP-ribosylation factor-like protein 4C [Branchiostoma belcheri]|uniref:ADP-ribosylation factor-like protein 11 n=1 Tax=Branchiostoma belcheri TaxID=7741 RepID=A0A6P4YDN0_BRABE|nr:PREDICTED: ADP-ribosylation factor-like protein 4C [Branchiostoma belcheri]